MVTRILMIRHAATNSGGRLCGSLDVPLSADGRSELEALLERTPRCLPPDALVTSTLRRATDVAQGLARAWCRDVRPANWAREIDCGEVEGMPLDELRREFPDVWARNQAQADEAFAWPGGETYAQFRARIVDGLSATAAAHAGGRIALVTHAGVISQVLGIIRHRPASVWSADRPDTLTGTEVIWENGALTGVVTFNARDWY
jgi:broad specificity phosphatase PhoE